jgi:hypothetical protein
VRGKVKDKRFEEIREGLYKELLNANLHFKIYWAIYNAPKDIKNIRNVYISFFYFTMRGHNDRFCLGIYNVVKPDADTANFIKLFNYIRSSKELSKIIDLGEIDEMGATIQSHQETIEKIKVIRDQYVAHNQLTDKHLDEGPSYKYEEGKRLLIDLNNILQKVSRQYDHKGYWRDNNDLLDITPGLNVEDMLRHLTEYRNEHTTKRRLGA